MLKKFTNVGKRCAIPNAQTSHNMKSYGLALRAVQVRVAIKQ